MKLLIFEYITGGGFNKQELPDSLADEGRLMLQALLDNLAGISGIEPVVMLDSRVTGSINTAGINTLIIKPEHNSHEEFARLAHYCDAVWPIAPEFDGILQALCQTVELMGKLLLTSPVGAVAITGNKFYTWLHFNQHQIATIPTRLLDTVSYSAGEWIIKPVDGVGCGDSYLIVDRQDFELMSTRIGRYIIQPHIAGKKTSLSCLFKQGHGWLLCANLQHFSIINKQYRLSEITVNYYTDLSVYQTLVDNIARVLPELWGYVGIDLIETPEQILVLEINPRLTTSFVGIYDATGINVAEAVLQLLTGLPIPTATCNQPVTIKVK